MATTDASLPPLAEISLVGIWVETVLYGFNCIMYGLCMFILLRGGKTPPVRRMLAVMSTALFLLCTAHVGSSLRQLLEAFVYVPADVPNYSVIYWLETSSTLFLIKDYLYNTLLLFQYSILIWRLYVVFLCDWRVIVLPIILLLGCLGPFYTITSILADPSIGLHSTVVSKLVDAGWSFDMFLNVALTLTIAVRLWWMGRKMPFSMPTRSNRYIASVYVIIESGAMFVITNILLIVFYLTNNPAAFPLIDIVSQLAALMPYLIVVQVGLTGRYHIPHVASGDVTMSTVLTVKDEIVFRSGTLVERDV